MAVMLTALLIAGVVALHWRDPHQSGSWGWCWWRVLTGVPCPGCGGLRAVADLTGGRFTDAWAHHAYLVASLVTAFAVVCAVAVVAAVTAALGVGAGLRHAVSRALRRALRAWQLAAIWSAGFLVFAAVRVAHPPWWPPWGVG